jgi:uncharacterized protein YkwD
MTTTFRTLLIALLAAALVAPAAATAHSRFRYQQQHRHHHRSTLKAPVAKAVKDCPDADLEPNASNLGRVRAAILCLHNQIRAEHRLPLLHEHKRLRSAALGHSRDMVRAHYFEHTTPSGRTMVDRILAAHYVREDQGWALGENLEWGTGSMATPRGAVQAWMKSPGHRANILQRSFREMGVGVVVGVPVSSAAGATYTVDFGVRR